MATLRTKAYLDMMKLFGGEDIANLDGEMVECGHVLMPVVNNVSVYPENYTSKTPMYFEKLGGTRSEKFCGMTKTKTAYPISRPYAY
jgi:hypothetical protein